jgi:hypothetical protein
MTLLTFSLFVQKTPLLSVCEGAAVTKRSVDQGSFCSGEYAALFFVLERLSPTLLSNAGVNIRHMTSQIKDLEYTVLFTPSKPLSSLREGSVVTENIIFALF